VRIKKPWQQDVIFVKLTREPLKRLQHVLRKSRERNVRNEKLLIEKLELEPRPLEESSDKPFRFRHHLLLRLQWRNQHLHNSKVDLSLLKR
jgi:hypothetical protein